MLNKVICLILNLFVFLDQGCQTSRTKMTVSIAEVNAVY